MHLKKRSGFINITLGDITRLTDRFETIYSIGGDPQAVPPPADGALIGRYGRVPLRPLPGQLDKPVVGITST
jgi:hypothetical protein